MGEELSDFHTILTEQRIAIAEIRHDMASLARDVAQMNRFLIVGNGEDSLMTRVRIVEEQVSTAAVALKDMISVWEAARVTEQGGKWKLIVAVVGGLLGLAGAAMTAVLGLRHP